MVYFITIKIRKKLKLVLLKKLLKMLLKTFQNRGDGKGELDKRKIWKFCEYYNSTLFFLFFTEHFENF